MFDKIVYISDKDCDVKLKKDADVSFNLMNLHIIFEDKEKQILGEVDDLKDDIVRVRFLGEITPRGLLGGVIRKPTLDAKVRVIDPLEVPLVTGRDRRGFMLLGTSPFYNDKDVYIDVNEFFSNHFAVFGNSGSGKSCGISRIFQNMFQDERLFPYKSNIIMFDSSGEYYNAFKNLSSINPNYNYRYISTNETEGLGEVLRMPIYLLNVDDMTLLLNATSHSQIPIIERMLKLAKIFSEDGVDTNDYKNHLIAKAIMTILYTNETSPNKRNEIFSILASCSTPEFNLEAEIKGIGYTRKFRDCFLIDQFGNFTESVLMTEYISSFIKDEYDSYEPKGNVYYNLDTLEKALNFTLISEGWLRNENTYADAVTLKVRLHSLITGENAKFFDYKDFVTLEQYISSLLIVNGKKYQLVNINLDDVDDNFAKVIVKVYSRLIFAFSKSLGDRASIPFHLVVEEAHRYIQNDNDTFLIGYNIFDRIAKEGRKYGVLLGLITQRPVEMSDTVISQCSNFLIFKINHPADVEYIRKMVPNISDEIIEKQKTLQSGTCLAFGQGFKIPLIVKLKMPDPSPKSGNCDVVNIWDGNTTRKEEAVETDEEFVKKIEDEVHSKMNDTKPEEPPVEPKKEEEANNKEVEEKKEEEKPDDVEIAPPDIPIAPPVEDEEAEETTDDEEITRDEDEDIESATENDEDIDDTEEDEESDEEEVEDQDDEITPPDIDNEEEDQDTPDEEEESEEIENSNEEEASSENNDEFDSLIIPATKEKIDQEEQPTPVENNQENQNEAMNEINNNILAGLSNLQKTPEEQPQPENVNSSNIVAPINNEQRPNTVPPLPAIPEVEKVPDTNVAIPQMTPPANSENINMADNVVPSAGLVPNIKQQVENPSIIIPGGQNVDPAILQGFNGTATISANPENKTS